MRHHRRIGVFVTVVLVGIAMLNLAGKAAATTKLGSLIGTLPSLHVEGNRIVDPQGNPVMLRGISIPDVEYTQRYRRGGVVRAINDITDQTNGWYPRVLRIPVYPETDGVLPINGWITNATYFTQYLEPAVTQCINKKLYCIIDWHWVHSFAENDDPDHGIDLEEQQRVDAETRAFWTSMVGRYANHPNIIFELFNEPIFPNSWKAWHTTAQPWIDLIRGLGANNLILVGAPHWSLQTITPANTPFVGGNIVYTSHVYPGHTLPDPTQSMDGVQTTFFLNSQQNQWNTWFGYATNQYPVMITEFGWEPCEMPLVTGECQNHPVGGLTTLYGQPFKPYLESPFYRMPPRLPKVVGWTAWVADYCLGPRMLDQATRAALNGTNEQGQFIKTWLYERRNEYFPTPTVTETLTLLPSTNEPEHHPNDDCEFDEAPPPDEPGGYLEYEDLSLRAPAASPMAPAAPAGYLEYEDLSFLAPDEHKELAFADYEELA